MSLRESKPAHTRPAKARPTRPACHGRLARLRPTKASATASSSESVTCCLAVIYVARPSAPAGTFPGIRRPARKRYPPWSRF